MPKTAKPAKVKWFDEAKVKSGLSWNQISKTSGISYSLLIDYRRGYRHPSPKNAMMLGKLLGFDWKLFFDTDQSAC